MTEIENEESSSINQQSEDGKIIRLWQIAGQ